VHQDDRFSRGFLPNVVCQGVIAKPRNQVDTSQENNIIFVSLIRTVGFIVDKVALRQVVFLRVFLCHYSTSRLCVFIRLSPTL
jgi:hypothetical protein